MNVKTRLYLQQSNEVTTATFADNTAILKSSYNPNTALEILHNLNNVQEWLNK